jgi:hypothetical protein
MIQAFIVCTKGGYLIDISEPPKKSWFKPFPKIMELEMGKKTYSESYSL